MSNYVWGTSLSHADYLQAKSFVSDVKSATRDAARKVSMDNLASDSRCYCLK
jgi:hypothetical protein